MSVGRKAEAKTSMGYLELSQAARENNLVGFSVCVMNPSGCFDIAKGVSAQFPRVPYFRVFRPDKDSNFLDKPSSGFNASFDTVFFTGCNLISSILPILTTLRVTYQFTKIKYVYQIEPPHYTTKRCIQENEVEKMSEVVQATLGRCGYQYKLLYSGLGVYKQFPLTLNVGIPRWSLKLSEFEVPRECYGLIRHRGLEIDSPDIRKNIERHLEEYFHLVAEAGKDHREKPITVIVLEVKKNREWLLSIAKKSSIEIDFCDRFPENRLPHQEDFLIVLEVMKRKKGIVCLDELSTQSLLQALSLGASVLICSKLGYPTVGDDLIFEFHKHLLSLISTEYQFVAKVMLGLDGDYKLLRNRDHCEKVYEILRNEIEISHLQFEFFKNGYKMFEKVVTGITQGFFYRSSLSRIPQRPLDAPKQEAKTMAI
jgi:hypothetical protein